jgi:hypothetical protein
VTTSGFREFLHAAIADFERDVDRIEDLLSAGEGDRKVRLLAYAGYRNARLLRVSGRVVRFRPPLKTGEGSVRRFRAMMEIYNSHEVAGVPVRLEAHGRSMEAVSDEEGYVTFELPLDLRLPERTA